MNSHPATSAAFLRCSCILMLSCSLLFVLAFVCSSCRAGELAALLLRFWQIKRLAQAAFDQLQRRRAPPAEHMMCSAGGDNTCCGSRRAQRA